MKAYAQEQALEALTRRWTDKDGHRCYSYDGTRLAEVEAAINAVIERCAQAAALCWSGPEASDRIRALAAPPAAPK